MVNKVKNLGQYFTPRIVAEFMANLITKKTQAKILEPCAGKGIFLDVLWKKGFRNITAYEINSSLPNISPVEIKYCDFLQTDKHEKFDVIIGNPPYVRWRNVPLEIRKNFKEDTYWKDKINGLSDLLYAFVYLCVDKLNDRGELIFITPIFWTQTLHASNLRKYLYENGSLDVLISFNEMRIFKEVSSSIIIFKYVKRKTDKPIKIVHVWSKRELTVKILEKVKELLQRLDKEDYIKESFFEAYLHPQFGNGKPWKPLPPKISSILSKIEESCKYSPIITVDSNKGSLKVPISILLEREDLEEFNISPKTCKQVRFAGKVYYLYEKTRMTTLTSFIRQNKIIERFEHEIEKVPERFVRLGDIAEIGNGMVSGLDRAFKVVNSNKFSEEERKKFILVIKAKQLNQYYFTHATPYIFVNDIETEEELKKKKYPNIYNHLSRYRKMLDKRYNYGRNIPWWHWVFLRNQKLMESNYEKIFTPCKERIDKKGYVRFSYVNGPYYATQDVTVIVKKPHFREDTKYLLAILNSNIIFTWIRYKGLTRGGVVEFSEKPLSRIPIRLINWDDPAEVATHNKIVKLVEKILSAHNRGTYQEEIEKYIMRLYRIA